MKTAVIVTVEFTTKAGVKVVFSFEAFNQAAATDQAKAFLERLEAAGLVDKEQEHGQSA